MSEAGQASTGHIIEGRYRIIGKIAEGGMATVYEALDQRLSRTVAIKIMHTQLAQGPHRAEFEERFHREVRSAAAIANSHIVQVYDTGQINGREFLVMQYIHGVNLRHEMNEQGTFSVRETMRIIGEVLDGLASAHEAGVIHRDIKPENILLNDRGNVKITDFGLARAASQTTLSTTGMLLGTAAYLPPETIENNQATPQGDLYAVGIVAYEMLTGSVPFVSDNPVTVVFKHVHEDVPSLTQVCPGIDPQVSDFIAGLVARPIDDRPNDANQALESMKTMDTKLSSAALSFQSGTSVPSQPQHTGKLALKGSTPLAGSVSSNAVESTAKPTDLFEHVNDPVSQPDAQVDTAQSQVSSSDKSERGDQKPVSTQTKQFLAPADTPVADEQATEPMKAVYELSELDKKKPKRWFKKLITALVIIVLILALVAGGAGWWYFKGPGSYWKLPRPSDSSCTTNSVCSIEGADFTKYKQSLTVAGIPHEESQAYSDTVPQGHIISAEPKTVESHISKRNGKVKLVVSRGIQKVTVPADLLDPHTESGMHPIDALKAAGFSNIVHDENQDQYSMDLPAGAAITVTPQPNSTVNHNEQVTVTLSKGKMPVSMPDIVGKSKQEATNALNAARLATTYNEAWSDTIASGQIISASAKPGSQLHWGDQVSVMVSKGPQMVELDNLVGKNKDEAIQILKAKGLDVKITAPLGDISHTVRLQSPTPGPIRVHGEDGKPTVITLTVV